MQGVGTIKNINNFDVYVKHDQCEVSIKDIHKRLKNENISNPIIKLTLGEWRFLQNDLMPLLNFHKKDKKLSFLTVMLMVQITEVPKHGDTDVTEEVWKRCWFNPASQYYHRMMEILRSYKEAFLAP